MARHRRSYRRSYRPRFRRHRGKMTIPIAPIAGLAAGLIGPMQNAMAGNFEFAGAQVVANYTGFAGVETGHPHFDVANLQNGLVPLIAGLLVHKFIGGAPINANAALARAKIPFIRI